MHPLDALNLFGLVIVLPLGLLVAYLAHRQRLEDEAAEEAERAQRTPAE